MASSAVETNGVACACLLQPRSIVWVVSVSCCNQINVPHCTRFDLKLLNVCTRRCETCSVETGLLRLSANMFMLKKFSASKLLFL